MSTHDAVLARDLGDVLAAVRNGRLEATRAADVLEADLTIYAGEISGSYRRTIRAYADELRTGYDGTFDDAQRVAHRLLALSAAEN